MSGGQGDPPAPRRVKHGRKLVPGDPTPRVHTGPQVREVHIHVDRNKLKEGGTTSGYGRVSDLV